MKNNSIIILITIVAAALGLYVGNTMQRPEVAINPNAPAAPTLVDFGLPLTTGEQKKLSTWKGKIIVLNFWATWCPPCRKEIPTFVKLQTQWQDKNVQFVGVALDEIDKVTAFIDKYQVNYPNMAGVLDDIEVSFGMGNSTSVLPFTVVIDQDFTIVASHAGEMTQSMLEKVIVPLF